MVNYLSQATRQAAPSPPSLRRRAAERRRWKSYTDEAATTETSSWAIAPCFLSSRRHQRRLAARRCHVENAQRAEAAPLTALICLQSACSRASRSLMVSASADSRRTTRARSKSPMSRPGLTLRRSALSCWSERRAPRRCRRARRLPRSGRAGPSSARGRARSERRPSDLPARDLPAEKFRALPVSGGLAPMCRSGVRAARSRPRCLPGRPA
jgi:hypothetical protein